MKKKRKHCDTLAANIIKVQAGRELENVQIFSLS